MKLCELLDICNRLAEEKPCAKDYEVLVATYGRAPSSAVKEVEVGLDWDDEVILLMPDKALIRKGKK